LTKDRNNEFKDSLKLVGNFLKDIVTFHYGDELNASAKRYSKVSEDKSNQIKSCLEKILMIVPNLEYNSWIIDNEEKMDSTKSRRQYDSFVTNSFIDDHCSSKQKSERGKKCCGFKIKATAFVERKFEIKR
jgi:hypothetical protein